MNGYGQFRSRLYFGKKRPYTLRLKNKASRKQDEARELFRWERTLRT